MSYIVSNHDFTHGELDKTLFARSDLTFYNKAAQKLQNVVVLPGGGARCRFGTQTTGISLPALATQFQMFKWRTGIFDYLVILGNVSAAGIKVIKIDDGSQTDFPNPFSADDVEGRRVRGAQQQNELILVAGSAIPFQFTSDPTTGAVTGVNYSFKNPPSYDFLNNYDTNTFTLSSVAVTAASVPDASCPTLTVSGTPTFTFTSDFIGGYFEALGPSTGVQIGRGKIVAFDSPTVVRVRISSEFGSAANVGTQCVITESAYNATRGFPVAVGFYEDRLLFAGGKGVPQSIFMSAIGDFRDFDPGQGLPSDSINYTIASGQSDQIINMTSARSLQVFTTSGEHAAPVWGNEGLTPDTVAVRRQTSNGSTSTEPTILDTATLYVKRGGRAVMAFLYGAASQAYSSSDVSVMSSHLIRNPLDMQSYTVNDAYDSNILLLINGDVDNTGGSLVTYETLQEQNVSAWASTTTYQGKSTDVSSFDDYWNNVCVVGDEVYFITTRGASTNKYLEKMDWTKCMDGAVSELVVSTGPQTLSLPGATHLHGRTVQVITNVGSDSTRPTATYIGSFQMSATGDIEIDIPLAGEYWIGLGWDFYIQTMPAHVTAQTGDTLYTKKTISKVYVQYVDSYSFMVNGNEVPIDQLAAGDPATGLTLDSPAEPADGIYMMPTIFGGWTRSAIAEVKMSYPLPVTILGISVVLTA